MSEIGEDPYNSMPGSSRARDAFTREVKRDVPFGRPPRMYDQRLIGYDRVEARSQPEVQWHVGKDDRMSAEDASQRMRMLYKAYGIHGASPAEMESFHNAVYFFHTVNSGSTLQPGRSFLVVRGTRLKADELLKVLGNDIRRFFRTYADEVRETNRKVLAEVQRTEDIEAQERYHWLIQVAQERGLQRHPDLCHDSSDACWGLSASERAALGASKAGVFASVMNMADQANVPRTVEQGKSTTIYQPGATAVASGL